MVHQRFARIILVVASAAICLTAALPASQQDPANSTQTFRASADLLLLDVSVLDKARHPVTGLTAADFTVLVDGTPRSVVAFKPVDVPAPEPPSSSAATWTREVASDVATNDHPPGRVVAILVDDSTIRATDPWVRRTALSVVDGLGPDDRAAVVYAMNNHTAQTFTPDRRLLRAAIQRSAIFTDLPEVSVDTVSGPTTIDAGAQGGCWCGVCPIEALRRVAEALQPLSEQRKIIVYISQGSATPVQRFQNGGPTLPDQVCLRERRDAMYDALEQLKLANVTVEAFDPSGLGLGSADMGASRQTWTNRGGPFRPLEHPEIQRIEFLRTVAESTGGRAVVNSNDPDRQVPVVLAESGSYYLLGVNPPTPNADGRFHPVQVRVNRRGVNVRTRSGYYDRSVSDRVVNPAGATASDAAPAIGGPMPATGFRLELAAAPFATSGSQPAVALALSVWPPEGAGARPTPRTEMADVIASLYNPETGDGAGSLQQRLSLAWTRPDTRFQQYRGPLATAGQGRAIRASRGCEDRGRPDRERLHVD